LLTKRIIAKWRFGIDVRPVPEKKLDAVVLPLVASLHQWSPSVTVLLVDQVGMLLHEVFKQLEVAQVRGDVS
jgi:hypothetical protein